MLQKLEVQGLVNPKKQQQLKRACEWYRAVQGIFSSWNNQNYKYDKEFGVDDSIKFDE